MLQWSRSKDFLEKRFETKITPKELYDHQQLDWQDRTFPLALVNIYGEESFLFFVKDHGRVLSIHRSKPNNTTLLSEKAHRILQMEAGIPQFGEDITEGTLFPETGLQTECVSYTQRLLCGTGNRSQSQIQRKCQQKSNGDSIR